MSEWQRWRKMTAEQIQLREWRRDGALDAVATIAARTALGPARDAALWRWFLDRLALWLGVALCAAGVIYFIAANWDEIGKFTRLFGMQALMIAGVAVAARLGLARTGGQAALWLAMVLLGGLLALIGQTYRPVPTPGNYSRCGQCWRCRGRSPAGMRRSSTADDG